MSSRPSPGTDSQRAGSRAGSPQDLTSLLVAGVMLQWPRLSPSGLASTLTARSPLPPSLPDAILPAHCNADPCRPAEALPGLGTGGPGTQGGQARPVSG